MRTFITRRRRDANAALLHSMLDRLKVDLGAIWRPLLAGRMHRVIRGCRRCADPNRCEAWLAGDGPLHERYRFCPCAETLDTLPRRF